MVDCGSHVIWQIILHDSYRGLCSHESAIHVVMLSGKLAVASLGSAHVSIQRITMLFSTVS
jgi:hypothetical protein